MRVARPFSQPRGGNSLWNSLWVCKGYIDYLLGELAYKYNWFPYHFSHPIFHSGPGVTYSLRHGVNSGYRKFTENITLRNKVNERIETIDLLVLLAEKYLDIWINLSFSKRTNSLQYKLLIVLKYYGNPGFWFSTPDNTKSKPWRMSVYLTINFCRIFRRHHQRSTHVLSFNPSYLCIELSSIDFNDFLERMENLRSCVCQPGTVRFKGPGSERVWVRPGYNDNFTSYW